MLIIQKQFNWSSALAKRSTIDMIVLHHANATSCTVDQIHEWHLANSWSGFGYHYFVDKKGQIFKGRPDDTIGSHAKGFRDTGDPFI